MFCKYTRSCHVFEKKLLTNGNAQQLQFIFSDNSFVSVYVGLIV